LAFQDDADRLSGNFGNQLPFFAAHHFQKSDDVVYNAAKVWNQVGVAHSDQGASCPKKKLWTRIWSESYCIQNWYNL